MVAKRPKYMGVFAIPLSTRQKSLILQTPPTFFVGASYFLRGLDDVFLHNIRS